MGSEIAWNEGICDLDEQVLEVLHVHGVVCYHLEVVDAQEAGQRLDDVACQIHVVCPDRHLPRTKDLFFKIQNLLQYSFLSLSSIFFHG